MRSVKWPASLATVAFYSEKITKVKIEDFPKKIHRLMGVSNV